MASIECYLKELDNQRDKLANTLVNVFDIEASTDEKFNSLVEKVATIKTGDGKAPAEALLYTEGVYALLGHAELIEE